MSSLTIAWNVIRRTIGTKKGLLGYILLPCVVISLVIALLGQEEMTLSQIAYVDRDQGLASAFLLEELADKPGYALKKYEDAAAMKDALLSKQAAIGFAIPAGFTEGVRSGRVTKLQVYDLATSEATFTLRINLDGLIRGMTASAGMVRTAAGEGGQDNAALADVFRETGKHRVTAIDQELRLYPKEGLSTVTGFTLLFLMSLISSSVTQIVEDRSKRTMARIYSAPVRAWEIAAGNFLGSFFVGLIQIAVVLMLSRWVLRYDAGIPLHLHFIVLAAFMLVAMGIASAAAGLIRNPQNAGMLNNLIITPTCMIGGCFWPISFMPEYMQKAANFVPQKWTIEAIELLSSGSSLKEVVTPLLILVLMAFVLLIIGSAILRPSEGQARA
ncbi:ABC transporter permease [Paenibacillus woosongensis]|uniref:Multidrug ABC transporter ATP-binding protein n=1 Tax=Paenibacillus woosongensis TaxID=307580 RepID=A0ABQ4MSY7_9BACL|nr:ABC transporter permease [Paenibacillus woosongensis]GIP58630.1 multidrug ABC transporter ATP-binding protein [Paenibacillus woosongensis]